MSHAILSPSSAARWISCPPSARINAEAPQTDTVYTREGTLAHAMAELKARKYFLGGIGPRKFAAEMKKFQADELWQDEMDGHTETYLEALKDIAAQYDAAPFVALEQKVDFSVYVPEGFGTADCIMIGGNVLSIVDFKYGKGVAVSAEANPQMMLYALGALLDYAPIYEIDTVVMTIVQPRVKAEPERWAMRADDLVTWAETIVRPAAALAAKGEGEFAEGDWCRFCAIRGSCRARAGANTALEDFAFRLPHGVEPRGSYAGRSPAEPATASRPDGLPPSQLPPELTDEEVSRALTLGRRLAAWLSDLEEYALSACLSGHEIPGWKAVEGRSVRAWTDQDAAFAAAEIYLGEDAAAMLYERRPVTLAQMEKIMGKKEFAQVMGGYVTTPAGKPTLAEAGDKRPAITRPTAKEDFKEE